MSLRPSKCHHVAGHTVSPGAVASGLQRYAVSHRTCKAAISHNPFTISLAGNFTASVFQSETGCGFWQIAKAFTNNAHCEAAHLQCDPQVGLRPPVETQPPISQRCRRSIASRLRLLSAAASRSLGSVLALSQGSYALWAWGGFSSIWMVSRRRHTRVTDPGLRGREVAAVRTAVAGYRSSIAGCACAPSVVDRPASAGSPEPKCPSLPRHGWCPRRGVLSIDAAGPNPGRPPAPQRADVLRARVNRKPTTAHLPFHRAGWPAVTRHRGAIPDIRSASPWGSHSFARVAGARR